jgi:SGNH hydrolase-like domain, acetyltransferase AlgX
MAMKISEMVRDTAPMSRLERAAAGVFVVALLVPGVALIAGVRPVQLENATPAAMPSLSIDALADTETYAQVDRALVDAFPGRDRAVRAYAALDYQLLGGSTNPDVVVGHDDWLFFTGELRPTCGASADGLLAQVDEVEAMARARGLDTRFVIAPDKHSVYPERVASGDTIPPACTDDQRAAMRAGMAARPGSTVDLWAPLLAARDAATDPVYYAQDSHWTPAGALPAVRALVDSFDPGVWDPSEVTDAPARPFPMELARLLGIPRNGYAPGYHVRPSMEVTRSTIATDVDLTEAADITDYTVTGDRPVIPGTTLFVYDSFFNIDRLLIVPWFERSIWVHVGDLRSHPELIDDLPEIDRVVVERVERDAYDLDLISLLEPVLDRP